MDEGASSAAAKRERIKAISRTVHSIPVEEGGQMRPPKPQPLAVPQERKWLGGVLAAGGVGALALGFAAGLFAGRRRDA
nr:hypothetical protein [uncultured Sphingomonas sp.]